MSRGPLTPIARAGRGPRASDRVFDELAAAIRDLRLPPGASLSETELSVRLQVSRTPLREALARLVDAGLVVVIPQVGTSVALISLQDVEEARFVRENLEIAAFAQVCGKPDVNISGMRELLDVQERCYAEDDLDGFFTADEALHSAIFTLAGYPGAWQTVQRMKVQLDRLRRLSLPEPSTIRTLIDEHRLIVEAVETHDLRAGKATISKHAKRVLKEGPGLRAKYPDYFSE
jgi:DNA-binding GntR family transcriptional regulator